MKRLIISLIFILSCSLCFADVASHNPILQDEGTTVSGNGRIINFAGSGVNVTFTGGKYVVTVSSSGGAVSDEAYGEPWNNSTEIAPSRNAVYDKIESLAGGHDALTLAADADAIFGLSAQQLNLDTQTANTIFAGPTSGAAADPAFRVLVDADIPDNITASNYQPVNTTLTELSVLTDPGANRIPFWNDTSNNFEFIDYSGWDTNASNDFDGDPDSIAGDTVDDDKIDAAILAGVLKSGDTDNVKDTHIDFGTGANQVSTDDLPQGSTNLWCNETNIKSSLSNDFHNIGGTDDDVPDNDDVDPDFLKGDSTDDDLLDPGIVNGVKDKDYGDITVSSGSWAVEDDSHTHTSSTISGLDISDDTNLAVGLALDLVDDTVSFDPTEITGGTTWDDGGEASVVWSWNLSAGDPTITFGNDLITFSNSITIATGKNITLGTTKWNNGDGIDGTKVADADLGDIGVSSGVWSVENDSHDHTSSTLPSTTSYLGAQINASEMASEDFGDFTCNGTSCTVDNSAISYAKFQDVSATARLLGRNSAGAGIVEELNASTAKTLLSLNNVENTALSTWVGSSNLATLASGAVSYSEMQNASDTDKLLGRVSAGAGVIEEITFTDFAQSILDDADEATFKATVNLEIGTDVQAYDADLASAAGGVTGIVKGGGNGNGYSAASEGTDYLAGSRINDSKSDGDTDYVYSADKVTDLVAAKQGTLTNSAGLASALSDETGTDKAVFSDSPTFADDITIHAAGVKLTGDGDGALTILGLGNGYDEDLTFNLDDTENQGVLTSSTGLTSLNFSSIDLIVPASAYNATTWDGNNTVPTRDDIRDKFESLVTGATAWDDIADPDADTTIALGGYETVMTSTLDEANHIVLKIDNSDADLANDIYGLVVEFTDDGDANGIFLDLRDNNGDSKFKVGANGTITDAAYTSNFCHAYLPSNQLDFTDATATKVAINTTTSDPLSQFNSTNNRFIAAEAGYYWAMGEAFIITPVANKRFTLGLRKNNAEFAIAVVHSVIVDYLGPIVTGIVYCSVGDYIELFFQPDVGANTTDLLGAEPHTSLTIKRIF